MKLHGLPISACLLVLAILPTMLTAQNNSTHLLKQYSTLPARLSAYVQKGQTAVFDQAAANRLLQSKPSHWVLSFRFENQDWEIELEQSNLFSKGFAVTTGTAPNSRYPYNATALYYKGKVKGKPHSMAAISVLPDRLVAVIADEKGNINIGAVKDPSTPGEHIVYREADLRIANEFMCGTDETAIANDAPLPVYTAPTNRATINSEPVDMYFEADYSVYTNNGSNVNNVVNYVTALFNVVHTLYDNDSINVRISGIKVWNTNDPYASYSTTATALPAFGTAMATGFPGDLAHLLSQRGLGGGRAYIDVLCAGNSSKVAVSGNLSNSFSAFPVYSWSAMVVTHETGHNLGSPHTQACSWPGGAIDNCYPVEGSCSQGPAPTNGGTIMSYCHLTGYGINFANGFGPLPGERIRSRVRSNSPCINPNVYFETTFQNITEENADVANGCLDYKLLTTKLKIPYAPSQPAAITLTPTGNAGLVIGSNGDIEISPLTFVLDSGNLSQTINCKVFNDAIVENVETLTLNFLLDANGGNAVKRSNITHTINITSLDHRPDSSVNELLYFEPFDSATIGAGSWTQTVVYGNTSPNRWVIGISGDTSFPSKAAYISNNGSAYAYSGTTVNDSTAVRLISPTINATGFSNIRLSYLYKCNGETSFVNGVGTSGGLTGRDAGRVYYSINNGTNWTLLRDNIAGRSSFDDLLLPADANNSNALRIAFEWFNNTSVVNNPPLLIDSIIIKGTSTRPIQTAAHVANSFTAWLGPNQTVHYYNPVTKNIMATIENLSGADFGCTQVSLLRTGNNALPAWGNMPNEMVTAKAYQITSDSSYANAPYRLTLYYTDAEINGWLAATGNTLADMSIAQTNGDITQAPLATSVTFPGYRNVSSYGSTAHTAITGIFNGFSTFALGKPFAPPTCPGNVIKYTAGINGLSYQWQANSGSGYTNINDGAIYAGTSSDTLQLSAAPTTLYGNKYRCVITTAQGNLYSQEYVLQFGAVWLGTTSQAWENPANWSCGLLPDANTDVWINAEAPFYPEISTNTTIRSLHTQSATTISIKSGVLLTIAK